LGKGNSEEKEEGEKRRVRQRRDMVVVCEWVKLLLL
jgi:hypothetical protein